MIKFDSFYNETCDTSLLFNEILKQKDECISGYYNLPYLNFAVDEGKKYIFSKKDLIIDLTHIVIIGIGGSSLGLKAIDSMLYHLPNRNNVSLKFLEHTDPIKIQKSLKKIKLQSTIFIIISKSGTTIETTSLMKYVFKTYNLLDGNLKQRILFITDKNSPLYNFGVKNAIHTIGIDKNIGGRFCALSAMGVVPLMLLGYEVENILKGARNFACSFFDKKQDHLLQKAIFLARHADIYSINILFSYSSSFRDFNSWYVQLWGESLGKLDRHGINKGLTPISLIGSIDQHSFLQLILQGKKDKSVTFLNIKQNRYVKQKIPNLLLEGFEETNFVNGISFSTLLNSQQIATMNTLKDNKIPTDLIELESLDEENIGALIYYYELLTSAVGCLFEINTYDQPAVEFGKKRLKQMLESKS